MTTQSASVGVKFDLFADGTKVNTGWVSGSDGLLVLDRNHDGQINDGSELFGSSTILANGTKATDGYAALRELDTNHDGVVNHDDAAFADLRVWVDSNSDGISSTSELKTLDDLGIKQLNLQVSADISKDHGNLIGLTSTYETTDGATHAAADVWFVADKSQGKQSDTSAASVDAAIAAINSSVATESSAPASIDNALTAQGNAPSVSSTAASETDALKTVSIDAAQPFTKATASTDPQGDLRSRVSSLAQAMGSFGNSGSSDSNLSGTGLDTKGGTSSGNTAAVLTVASMADVMKQFDANGKPVGSLGTVAATSSKTLNLPGLQDTGSNGFLTAGGSK